MLVQHGVNVLKSSGVLDKKIEQKSFDNPIAAGEDRSLDKSDRMSDELICQTSVRRHFSRNWAHLDVFNAWTATYAIRSLKHL